MSIMIGQIRQSKQSFEKLDDCSNGIILQIEILSRIEITFDLAEWPAAIHSHGKPLNNKSGISGN